MNLSDYQLDLIEKIRRLKKDKNATILVHNYQRPEIYKIADFIGDSLGLCMEAKKTNADIIVFCGVHFMAESAAILNNDKKVIVPHLDAGCAMADMIDAERFKDFKKNYPKAVSVCYVNTTAEIKAECDVCCTSSNAVEVVKNLNSNVIIFVPDENLANYVASQVPEKRIIPWKGFCPIHHCLTKEYLKEIQSQHPKAKIIAHPECKSEILQGADYVSSTSGMIDCARNDDAKEFFILTECGMIERLQMELPAKKFYGFCNMCFDMKKNTLKSVLKCLESEKPIVKVNQKTAKKALLSFEKMFELTKTNE